MSARKQLTIGLPWHSTNSSNLGLGALTECQLDIVQAAADELGIEVQFEVLFWLDGTDTYVERPNLTFCAFDKKFLLSPHKGLLSFASRCDLVLDIAGGDSFTDNYGVRRFVFQAITKCAVILVRTPLILSPQTLGPFNRWWCRGVAGWIMRRARAVVSRDLMSSELARSLGAGSRLVESTDVAFRLPFRTPDPPRNGPLRVGINVSGLLFRGGYDQKNYFDLSIDYVDLIRTLLERLTARDDIEVHLIGHVLVPLKFESVDDDLRVAVALGKDYPGTRVAPEFRNPSEAKSYIAGMDVFAGSRMHACIAAFSSGVPVIPLAYSRKFKGLFSTLDYPIVADCLEDTKEEILEKIDHGITHREKLRAKVVDGNACTLALLARYDSLVRECLDEASGTPVVVSSG